MVSVSPPSVLIASSERQVSIATTTTTSSSSLSEARPDFHHANLVRTPTVETTWSDFDEENEALDHHHRLEDNVAEVSTATLLKKGIAPPHAGSLSDPVLALQRRIVTRLQNLDHQQFYGHEQDQLLLEAYKLMNINTNCETSQNVILISGSNEQSRTLALAHSLRNHVEGVDGGYMVSGRFDCVRTTCTVAPYSAFVDAFEQFATRVVQEGDVELMRTAITENIGVVGTDILTDMLPSLNKILKDEDDDEEEQELKKRKKASTASRGSNNAMSRFVVVFKTFLEAIASQKPLVIVLEDIHLADKCSMMLLRGLASDTPGVRFICTCNNTTSATTTSEEEEGTSSLQKEVDNDDLPTKLIKFFDESNVTVKHIQVQRLCSNDVGNMVHDLLLGRSDTRGGTTATTRIPSLANILSKRTQGNSVYVIEAMKSLYEQGLLTYDKNGGWTWDESKVEKHLQKQDDFGDFLLQEAKLLPPQIKELLKVASCLGSQLDEDMLSYALSAPVGHYLNIAANRYGLLKRNSVTGQYSFAHDGIQTASYGLIDVKEREKFHLAIAKRLCKCFHRDELEKHVFIILDQFQRGKRYIGENEKYVTVDLCLLGAQRASRSSSFRIAGTCLTFGISLLDRNSFKDEYDLCLALYTNAAEVYFITADDVRMDESIEAVLQNALCFKDKLGALTTHVYALGTRNRSCEAVEVAHGVLEELGVQIERNPSRLRIMAEFKHVKKLLGNKTDQSILRMQRMTDPDKLAALQVLNVLFLNAYMAESKGAPLIGLKMVELTLQHGLCAASSFGFAIYAHLMVSRDIDRAYAYAKLALSIVERFNAKEWVPRVHVLVYGGIHAWKVSTADCLGPLKNGHKIGLETGDHEYSMLCANLYAMTAVDILPADELYCECKKFAHFMVIAKQDMALQWMESTQKMLEVLMGKVPYSCSAAITNRATNNMDSEDTSGSNMFSLVTMYNQMLLGCVFEDGQTCYNLARECWDQLMRKEFEAYETVDFCFMCGLASATAMRIVANNGRDRARYNNILKSAIRKFRNWSKSSPQSTYSKLFLLQAEDAALKNQDRRAAGKYLVAIATAQSVGFQYEIALGNECAGRFYLSRGKKEEAVPHYKKALEAYEAAKATGKVNHLRQELDLLHEGMLGASAISPAL